MRIERLLPVASFQALRDEVISLEVAEGRSSRRSREGQEGESLHYEGDIAPSEWHAQESPRRGFALTYGEHAGTYTHLS